MNVREVTRWFGITFFLVLILALIIIPVTAETFRPSQGDMVAIGSTVDITGVMGFGEGFAYYGYSGDTDSDPLYVYTMPDRKSAYYQFYVDPAIFGGRLGPWYQFVGNNTGVEHGNLLAFRVVKELPKQNLTANATTLAPTPTPIPKVVDSKPFSTDFQIAYGDPLFLPVNTKQPPPRLWVFGRLDSIYNKSFPKQLASLSPKEIQNLEPGSYTVLAQFPGKNTIFEAGYSKIVTDFDTKELLTSPWVSVKPVNIYGVQPRMVLIEFRKMIAGSDDTLTEYRMEVVNPIIDISSIDETYSEGKDVLDIRGYTNVAKGTVITFVMDKDNLVEHIRDTTVFTSVVQETNSNAWRFFQILIPIDYENIKVGQHQITATSPQGATQNVPFYIYDMPKGQVKPNETIKYVAGNIFVPTPTPLVVTVVQTQIVTQTIFVPVTPNDEQVYMQQKKASDENWNRWVSIGVSLLVVGCVAGFGGWYLVRVVKQARLR